MFLQAPPLRNGLPRLCKICYFWPTFFILQVFLITYEQIGQFSLYLIQTSCNWVKPGGGSKTEVIQGLKYI